MGTSSRDLNRKRKTIGFRLASWYFLVFTVSSLALFGVAYFFLSSSLEQKDRELIESELKLFASRYQSGGLEALIAEVNRGPKESFFVRVAGPGNQTLFRNMPAQWDDFDATELKTTASRPDRDWTFLRGKEEGELFEDLELLEIKSITMPDGVLLQVGRSTEGRRDILDNFQGLFAVALVAVLGLGIAGGVLLARRSLRPVRDLAGALRSVRETGQLTARVPAPQTGDELDELAAQFNALLETIEGLVNRMRSALDNIAHELRTPMTRLRGAAETALRSEANAETCKQALSDCLEEAEQTLIVLNTLMDVAEAEAGAMKLDLTKVDVRALIGSAAGLYEHVAAEKHITLAAALPEPLCVQADAKRLRQALANLLDNAIKYTPPGGRIEVGARLEPPCVRISVKDTGAGIKPEELPKIWDRLYRGEAGHSERGLGLGLSLVRAVVQAHKGNVKVSSEPGRGSEFVIELPLGVPG